MKRRAAQWRPGYMLFGDAAPPNTWGRGPKKARDCRNPVSDLSRNDLPSKGSPLPADSTGVLCLSYTEGELRDGRSEEHTSELQSPCNLVCSLLLEKKK